MRNIKIGVQIKSLKNPDGKQILKATAPLNLIFEQDFDSEWLNRELTNFEKKYLSLLDGLKVLVKRIKSTYGQGRVLLYWELGDKLLKFNKEMTMGPLVLDGWVKHLVRDLAVSEKMLERSRKFRAFYPDISLVDSDRSFDSYVRTFEGGYISAKRKKE